MPLKCSCTFFLYRVLSDFFILITPTPSPSLSPCSLCRNSSSSAPSLAHYPSLASSPVSSFRLLLVHTMSETPKRRLLRKSGLQASPFGAPIKTVLSTSNNNNNNNNTNDNQANSSSASTKTPSDIITVTPMANPFLTDSSSANADSTDATSSSQENHSPTRRSARLSSIYSSNPSSLTNGSGSVKSPGGKLTPKRLVPPTTPKAKTILRTGVWGHIVGLKKQDETAYARYPIDKSYCSFGRGDSCDIRVQIDAVSVMHCKLLRRDDGEVRVVHAFFFCHPLRVGNDLSMDRLGLTYDNNIIIIGVAQGYIDQRHTTE